MRCTVGSVAIGWIDHGSSSVLPRFSHWMVPPDFVLNGFQSAPRAKSILPSPSMSAAAMQTLSAAVPPSMIVLRSQVGFLNQTTRF